MRSIRFMAFAVFAFFALVSIVGFYGYTLAKLSRRVSALEQNFHVSSRQKIDRGSDSPEYARSFSVKTLWGRNIIFTFSEEKEKDFPFVILHFWGTWCGPCREEMPSFLKFSQQYSSVTIATISWGDKLETAQKFFRESGFRKPPPYNFVKEEDVDSPDAKYYKLDVLPTTLFINRGKIVKRVEGSVNWQDPLVADAMKEFLADKPIVQHLAK